MSDAESSDAELSDAKAAAGCFPYLIDSSLVAGAMFVSFGAWRRGLETLGVDPSRSFVVAVAVDVVLLAILLGNAALRSALDEELEGGGAWFSPRRVVTYMVWGVVVVLYGWISLRGGGDWLDLY